MSAEEMRHKGEESETDTAVRGEKTEKELWGVV